MCDPVSAAVAGLKVMTAMQEYRSAKAVAKGKQIANEKTRRNSDRAYLNDIAKIDAEAVSATREKVAAEFELSQEANKEEAKALNTNAGNATKIIQDIAGTQDMQFLGVIRDFDTDVFNLANQETEAYSAQERRYNSIAPVVMPSKTGLLLEVGTIGMTSYQNNKKATAPDTGEVVAP
jgi:hypothetical protein|tara:strand:+ start:138 stop:671 length:534 start_codon:yes stop_codon:yes gene_type:complete